MELEFKSRAYLVAAMFIVRVTINVTVNVGHLETREVWSAVRHVYGRHVSGLVTCRAHPLYTQRPLLETVGEVRVNVM